MRLPCPSEPSKGVSLFEALVKWGDPDAAREMVELKEEYELPLLMVIPGDPPTPYQLKHRRYIELWEALTTELIRKLSIGELTGTCFVSPLSVNPQRQQISSELWELLKVDFDKSGAEGSGIKLIDIRIREADSASEQPQESSHLDKARLRRALGPWLTEQAQRYGSDWVKNDYFDAAKEHFGRHLTWHLFKEIWWSADLPENLREPGLRPSK